MTPQKIIAIVKRYEQELAALGVHKKRMDPSRAFSTLSRDEALSHAYYLCDGVQEYAKDPEKAGKTGRHLASIQMCLSFAGLYTLAELMNHNKP
jgi:hypothetical protein